MRRNSVKTSPIAAIALMVCASVGLAEPTKVYMIGNSLTDEVKYDTWIKLCESGGIESLYARKMIPGAPICWHKDHPNDGFGTKYGYPDKAFKEYTWDVLIMQPFVSSDREIPAAIHYANLLWEHSPNAKVYLYAQWPSRKSDDWIAAWQGMKDDRYTAVLEGLRTGTERGNQVFMIPTGWAMYRLHKKMELGLVPGYTSAWDLYSDGVHVSNVGSYLVGVSYYATIFGKTPVGLPIGGYQGQAGTAADYFQISNELAKMIQETVWEAVTAHPDSGVVTDIPVAVTLPSLAGAVEKEPYRYEIDAAFGKPPYKWSLAGGNLPDGVKLNESGFLDGSPAKQGSYLFTAKVTDSAGNSATRDFALQVGGDASPKVVTKTLPALRQGAYVDFRLESEGGNGAHNWSVEAGELPKGLVLQKNGHVSGSPSSQGDYKATLKVTDSDGSNPEFDTVALTGTITPADQGAVIFARRLEKDRLPKLDGVLDAAEGWTLTRELKKGLVGVPNNTVRFDSMWEDSTLFVALEVEDDALITTEGYGGRHSDLDCVVFYFDGKNNREKTYNFDDRRLAYGPTDKGNSDRGWNIGPRLASTVISKRTDKGYTMECKFKLGAMGVPDQVPGGKYDGAGAVIGFDIVNRDLDAKDGEQTRLGWQGTASNPDDPSRFGTLILMP